MKKNTKISFIISIFLFVAFGFCVTNSADAYYSNRQYTYNNRNNGFSQIIRPVAQNNNFWQNTYNNFSNRVLPFNGGWNWINYLQTLVQTRSVDTDNDRATLSGTIYTGNIDYVYVWFEYGENPNFLNDSTSERKIDGDNGSVTFEKTITGLDEDTRYFFRAVGEEKNGRRAYGAIMSFVTSDDYDSDDDSDDDEDIPEVNTGDANNITDDYAKIEGDVDMNDFDNGIVFFVYGEDESQVEDISDDYDTYNDIDEDDEDLQKVKVDSSLDDDDSYTLGISNLNDDADYYYRMCVQYENEDGDDEIQCGDVESFTTDEN